MKFQRALSGALVAISAVSAAIGPARAETIFTQLSTFIGSDGAFPNAGLLAGTDGVIYGTATGGGLSQDLSVGGVAFSLQPTEQGWTRTIIHQFGKVSGDGTSPHSRLVADRNGALYGTTYAGGARNQGTVFRMTKPTNGQTLWPTTVLYSFTGGNDGANPLSEVTFDSAGNLYGTTSMGGSHYQGTVWRLSPPSVGAGAWSVQTLYSFAGVDGSSPRAGVILRPVNGVQTLFGVTSLGGAGAHGTAFSLTAPPTPGGAWSYSLLHAFTGGADGGMPTAALIADKSLTLYGTAMQGGVAIPLTATTGGLVFRLTPPTGANTTWTETVLHTFTGIDDGAFPIGGLIQRSGGRLFGTSAGTRYGTCALNCGTVFMLTSNNGGQTGSTNGPWNQTILHRFDGTDGNLPSAGLVTTQSSDGLLSFYGVTEWGGTKGLGTVFRVTP